LAHYTRYYTDKSHCHQRTKVMGKQGQLGQFYLNKQTIFYSMKTILVPTDYSALSVSALDVAAQFAKQYGARIKLLHMVAFEVPAVMVTDSALPALSTYHDTDYYDEAMTRAQDSLQLLFKSPKYRGLRIETEAVNNFDGLARIIVNQKADLIVMGSSGAKGMKELMWGSNAETVVRRAKCPVLVIKKPIKKLSLNKVLYATDFQDTSFVKKINQLLSLEEAKPYFVCVNTPVNFNTSKILHREMEKLAKKLSLTDYHFTVFNAFTEEEGIRDYAQSIDADLIVMSTHGRTGLSHFWQGSIAEDVVNHADRPVLTLVG
jgi:nucleotide-binding universal stress UspA family protein